VINSAPEIVFHAVDLHENLVEMPASMAEIPHRLDPATADLGRENRAEPVPPEPHRLVRDVDAALREIGTRFGNRKRQRLWLAGAVLIGLLAYPLAAVTLPGGSYLAALAAGTFNRWQAGAGLMQVADPEGAHSIAKATRIVNANADALRGCAEAARKAGREQKCAISVQAGQ
jgi:hypothetical protein